MTVRERGAATEALIRHHNQYFAPALRSLVGRGSEMLSSRVPTSCFSRDLSGAEASNLWPACIIIRIGVFVRSVSTAGFQITLNRSQVALAFALQCGGRLQVLQPLPALFQARDRFLDAPHAEVHAAEIAQN